MDRVAGIAQGFALFDTPIGRCGIAWNDRGLTGLHLPDGKESATRARLARAFPNAREVAMPPNIERAVEQIVGLLRGEASQLASIALDMSAVPPFQRRVYEAARGISLGTTISYGDLATRIGQPGAARAVGQALGRNPFAIVVPCHRVLAAGGKVGGFSANGGVATKLRLLAIERDSPRLNGSAAPEATAAAFGFDPVAAVEHLRRADPALAVVIDAVGPFHMRLDRTSSLFLALAEAIVHQQLTGKAAATIFARVRALFPRPHEELTPLQIRTASDSKLRGAGLSRSKLLALRDLADKTLAGHLPSLSELHHLDDATIVERLTEVRGIGRWTVEMLLMFRLGRPDVLPIDDYGVRKGFAAAFRKRDLPTRAALDERGQRWRPYRSVASWYLWRAAEPSFRPLSRPRRALPGESARARARRLSE
ncbi:MAG TPA: methylated-DNA--[protein]-cysteine S-methyltransferase [Polyangia bacterium]|jgi:methylated-DNA-[protein]-cysteine S-methyltransferase|nr:methylated-DNA--[protein]-cysteine S-methyltransferase [Polyangia bacterium]